jgi:hypothetical protein
MIAEGGDKPRQDLIFNKFLSGVIKLLNKKGFLAVPLDGTEKSSRYDHDDPKGR